MKKALNVPLEEFYAGLIPAKMGRKPFLYPAESSHVAVL